MKCVLTAIGTRGDVFPFIGLGAGLQARGHDVTLITHAPFADYVRGAGLDFVQVGPEKEYLECLSANPAIWDAQEAWPEVAACCTGLAPELYDLLERTIEPARTVVVAHYLDLASPFLRERRQVPTVTVVGSPMGFRFADEYVADPEMLVPQLGSPRLPVSMGWSFSPLLTVALFPAWFAPAEPDWPECVRVTGFPLFDTIEPVPAHVDAFIAAGSPPIVFRPGPPVELGTDADQHAFVRAAVEACASLGRRGLLLNLRDTPPDLPSSMHAARFAPLTSILPRCAALVHHGGIGSVGVGLASGVPQLATPFCLDQPDNAARMKQLGVGDWLAPADVSGSAVAAKLQPLLGSSGVARRCKDLADRCRRVDGIAATCDLVESAAPPLVRRRVAQAAGAGATASGCG